MAAAVTVFENYPATVIDGVLHPVSGLPGTKEFPIGLAEIRKACDQEAARLDRIERWSRPRLPEPERKPRETTEELRAKHGPNWGIRNPDMAPRDSPFRTEADLRAEIGDAVFEALPNAADYDPRGVKKLGATAAVQQAIKDSTGPPQSESPDEAGDQLAQSVGM